MRTETLEIILVEDGYAYIVAIVICEGLRGQVDERVVRGLGGKCSINCDDEKINCYLIDNNGFVLVAEGLPFGEIHVARSHQGSPDETKRGEVLFGEAEGGGRHESLLQMGSSSRVTLYDYQAVCLIYSERSDSAHTLLDPYFALLAVAKWILTELIVFLVEFNLYSWWHSDLTVKAQRSGRPMYVPCDTEYPAFVSERTIKENTGNIDCDGCLKSFVVQQIPSSNLFMVVVDNKCDCSMVEQITMDPVEIIYILQRGFGGGEGREGEECGRALGGLGCERLKFQKDRRRPDTCHPFHPEENSMECGGAWGLTPSLAATLLCLLLPLFPR
ncbi:unnamed protein product [Boreogadus saida]